LYVRGIRSVKKRLAGMGEISARKIWLKILKERDHAGDTCVERGIITK
jgi:hypothetical protein